MAFTLTFLRMCVCGERAPSSPRTDPLLLLWEDVIVILTCGFFNHALSVLTRLRFGQLSLRTRVLILVANGLTEALLQVFLSCLETVYARVLCEPGPLNNRIESNANASLMFITIPPVRNSEETFTSRL